MIVIGGFLGGLFWGGFCCKGRCSHFFLKCTAYFTLGTTILRKLRDHYIKIAFLCFDPFLTGIALPGPPHYDSFFGVFITF